MLAAGIRPYPAELFRWGMVHRTGALRNVERDLTRLHLLPGDQAMMTEKGLRWHGGYYMCERAEAEQMRERARNYGYFPIDIAYQPRRNTVIFRREADMEEIEPWHLVERPDARANRDYFELLQLDTYESAENAVAAPIELAGEVQRIADRHEEVAQAAVAAKAADIAAAEAGVNMSKSALTSDLDEHGRLELELERKQTAWHLGEASPEQVPPPRPPADQSPTTSMPRCQRRTMRKNCARPGRQKVMTPQPLEVSRPRSASTRATLVPRVRVLCGRRETATYRPSPLHLYRGKMLIEALPDIMLAPEFMQRAAMRPPYDPAEREMPAEWRLHLVETLRRFFVPLSQHVELEQLFSRSLRSGYTGRDPAESAFWAGNSARVTALAERMRQPKVPVDSPPSTAMGFAHLGLSGSGKSWTWDPILSFYPQVIEHPRTAHYPSFVQIVWLKLEIPQDASVKGLCINILQAIDEILGTNYERIYMSDRPTLDNLIPRVGRVFANHALGALVLEEVQR